MPYLTKVVRVAALSIAVFPVMSNANDLENFLKMDCSALESLLPSDQSEREAVDRFINFEPDPSVLRYLAGDDSWFGDYYNHLLSKRYLVKGIRINDLPLAIKEQVNQPHQIEYIRSMRRNIEAQIEPLRKKYWDKSSPWKKYVVKSSNCQLKDLAENKESRQNIRLKSIVDESRSKFREGRIGYFNVKINSCSISDLPVTKKPYTEPKQWPGSRFVVIDAEFKNMDSEGRLPMEGALIVKHEGRELRYDTTETIMQEGFGIYFKSVNPLVTMPTKIVYRIPDEVKGEVSWEPARNPASKRLWCTFAVPKG